MLTNLGFLETKGVWPPPGERDRFEKYRYNRMLFEGDHGIVYNQLFKRIERVLGNFHEVISYPVVINYQKLLSLKVADLLVGDLPQIKAGDPGSPEQEAINRIVENSDLFTRLYEVVVDISRYGDGLLYVRPEGGHGVIDVTQPPLWVPVVDRDNIKRVLYHVLAWEYTETDSRGTKQHYLKAQIHEPGQYEERIYKLGYDPMGASGGSVILQDLIDSRVVQTGLDGVAVIQISNVTASDRCTGLDDYGDIDSVVAELLIRLGQISRILDKHAAPSVQGPQSALQRDPVTGEWALKLGNYFPRDSREDPEVSYITWDGQLAANFQHVERLINILYTVSEMGSALFGDLSNTQGQVPSGSALRRLMIAPLAKVNRIRVKVDTAIKQALYLCSQLGGEGIINLNPYDISITWQDGLPNDPVEESDIIIKRTAGKATMSQRRALMQYDSMSNDEAEQELSLILDEERAMDPMIVGPFETAGDPIEEE